MTYMPFSDLYGCSEGFVGLCSGLVGRPGLDPGTLGLKVPCSSG